MVFDPNPAATHDPVSGLITDPDWADIMNSNMFELGSTGSGWDIHQNADIGIVSANNDSNIVLRSSAYIRTLKIGQHVRAIFNLTTQFDDPGFSMGTGRLRARLPYPAAFPQIANGFIRMSGSINMGVIELVGDYAEMYHGYATGLGSSFAIQLQDVDATHPNVNGFTTLSDGMQLMTTYVAAE